MGTRGRSDRLNEGNLHKVTCECLSRRRISRLLPLRLGLYKEHAGPRARQEDKDLRREVKTQDEEGPEEEIRTRREEETAPHGKSISLPYVGRLARVERRIGS